MINIISENKAEAIIKQYENWINTISNKYSVPIAVIKAVLFMEMTHMDIFDVAADFVVHTNAFDKKDSSTGYGQIFGEVALQAIIFAIENNLTTYQDLGLDHLPDINNPDDIRYIWKKLQDNKTNIEVSTLNILLCAKQITGTIDFSKYDEDSLKRIFTRYNENTNEITEYGIETYNYYLKYL